MFDRLYKPVVVITIAIFLQVNTTNGQTIGDQSNISKDKIKLGPECNLTDFEREYIFTKVENLATFEDSPGNWFEFAQKNFDFESVVKNLPATLQVFHDSILVKFIVTKVGQICKIEILNGNTILADPAVKLLKTSPPWRSAVSGGRNLNAYRTLKIEVLIDRTKKEFKIIRNFKSYFNDNG